MVTFIQDTISMLQKMNLSSIPVGNSDAGSYFNNKVLAAVNFGVRVLIFSSPSPFFFFIMHFVLFWLTKFCLFVFFRWLARIHGSRTLVLLERQPGQPKISRINPWMWLIRYRMTLKCILLRLDGLPWVVLKNSLLSPPFSFNNLWTHLLIYLEFVDSSSWIEWTFLCFCT